MRFSDWSSDVCSSDLLLDLQRVEVLKGPQGTLFGRNTIGGALNIVTSDPGNEWKVKAEATTGRYNRVDFRGSLDAPVIPDILRLGFAISTKHRDGYQQRIPYTGDTGNRSEEHTSELQSLMRISYAVFCLKKKKKNNKNNTHKTN